MGFSGQHRRAGGLPVRSSRACAKEPFLACLLHVAKWLRDAAHIPEALPLPPYPADWILETVEVAPESLETRLYQVREAYDEAGKLLQA